MTTYLRILGRLGDDLTVRLRPGYLTDAPAWVDREGEGPLRAQVLDDDGRLIVEVPLRLEAQCGEDAAGRPVRLDRAVRGYVPVPPRARRVVLVHRDQPVHELIRPDGEPRVVLTWTPDARSGPVAVTWEADHPEGLDLEFFLRWSRDDGESWDRIGTRTRERSATIDLDALPGGERCRVAVVATDGFNTTTAVSDAVDLPPRPCVPILLAPGDGDVLAAGDPVALVGQGWWREEARSETEDLRWYLDDGEDPVAFGARAEVVLDEGRHRLVLAAGRDEREARAAVEVEAVRPG